MAAPRQPIYDSGVMEQPRDAGVDATHASWTIVSPPFAEHTLSKTAFATSMEQPYTYYSGRGGYGDQDLMDAIATTDRYDSVKGITLSGVTALVTGGSAGIGKSLVEQLVAAGAHVIIVVRDGARARANLGATADRVEIIPADLSRSEDQERVIAEIRLRHPDLGLLINNAGTQVQLSPTGLDATTFIEGMRAEVALNLTAPAALSFGLLPVLAMQRKAAIVNISSGLAIAPKRTAPVYCATKSGLSAFSTALRYRCEDNAPQIKVIDVIMDYVDTDMTRGRAGKKMTPEEAARQVLNGIRMAKPRVWIGRTRMLRIVNRIAPSIARRILRNG